MLEFRPVAQDASLGNRRRAKRQGGMVAEGRVAAFVVRTKAASCFSNSFVSYAPEAVRESARQTVSFVCHRSGKQAAKIVASKKRENFSNSLLLRWYPGADLNRKPID